MSTATTPLNWKIKRHDAKWLQFSDATCQSQPHGAPSLHGRAHVHRTCEWRSPGSMSMSSSALTPRASGQVRGSGRAGTMPGGGGGDGWSRIGESSSSSVLSVNAAGHPSVNTPAGCEPDEARRGGHGSHRTLNILVSTPAIVHSISCASLQSAFSVAVRLIAALSLGHVSLE